MVNTLMNLQELKITTQVKGKRPDWLRIFEKNGWKFLGSGAEASVGQHPTKPYVVKVFPTSSAYTLFLDFVRQHPDNPHLPRFSRWARPVPGTSPPMSYIRMERLREISTNNLFTGYMPEITYAWLVAEKHNTLLNSIWHHSVSHRLRQTLGVDVDAIQQEIASREINSSHKIWQLVGGAPSNEWKRIVDELFAFWEKSKARANIDLHSANFMLRGRTLVILDPYYFKVKGS